MAQALRKSPKQFSNPGKTSNSLSLNTVVGAGFLWSEARPYLDEVFIRKMRQTLLNKGFLAFHKLSGELCKDRHGFVDCGFLSAVAMNGSPTDTTARSVGAGFIPPAQKRLSTPNRFSEYLIKRQ